MNKIDTQKPVQGEDRAAASKESEEKAMSPESLQKLLNQAVAAGIVKLPSGVSNDRS